MCSKQGILTQENLSSNHNQCSCDSIYGTATACTHNGTEFNSSSKNRLQFGPNSKKSTTTNKNVVSRFKSGKDHTEKRCHSKSFSQTRAVREQFVPSKQKRMRATGKVINLYNLNMFMPYQHFIMEGLHLLKDLLKQKSYMRKVDLKDAQFCVPLHHSHRKYVQL